MAGVGRLRRSTVDFVPDQRSEDTATEAMAICSGCSVRTKCLADAVGEIWLVGIWAGTTTAGRKKLRRKRAA